MLATFGKNVREFFKLQSTDDYVEALKDLMRRITITKVQRGNGKSPVVGTWCHPKRAVFFARWRDSKFTVNRVTLGLATKKTYVGWTYLGLSHGKPVVIISESDLYKLIESQTG